MKHKNSYYLLVYGLLLLLTLFSVFPYYWMCLTSCRSPIDIFSSPPKLLPENLNLENYLTIFKLTNMHGYAWNTIKVSVIASGISCLFGIFAAYGFSRFKFKGKSLLFFVLLFTQLFPIVVLILPFYILWGKFGLINSHFSLVVQYIGLNVPLSVWLLKGFIDNVPFEIEEAAMIDGCSKIKTLFRIVFPIAAPGIASVFVYLFIECWREFLIAYTFIESDTLKTLSVGITSFQGQYSANWGAIMAASNLASLPIFLIFMFLQKYFIKGISMGSVKG